MTNVLLLFARASQAKNCCDNQVINFLVLYNKLSLIFADSILRCKLICFQSSKFSPPIHIRYEFSFDVIMRMHCAAGTVWSGSCSAAARRPPCAIAGVASFATAPCSHSPTSTARCPTRARSPTRRSPPTTRPTCTSCTSRTSTRSNRSSSHTTSSRPTAPPSHRPPSPPVESLRLHSLLAPALDLLSGSASTAGNANANSPSYRFPIPTTFSCPHRLKALNPHSPSTVSTSPSIPRSTLPSSASDSEGPSSANLKFALTRNRIHSYLNLFGFTVIPSSESPFHI